MWASFKTEALPHLESFTQFKTAAHRDARGKDICVLCRITYFQGKLRRTQNGWDTCVYITAKVLFSGAGDHKDLT